jgi:anaphase-promoting complex subunit 1
VLLDRLQNVNISKDDNFKNEFWYIRDVYEKLPNNSSFLAPYTVSTEDELYVKGTTAIWSRGITSESNESSPEICYTCETPIQYAFFCTENFLDPDYKVGDEGAINGKKKSIKDKEAVGLIDATSLQVYCKNGENFVSAIEGPISRIWVTKYCVLVEKEASSTMIDGQPVPLPRIFSIVHPLDDMFPILMKSTLGVISYLTESEYKIIFCSPDTDLVLMFDTKTVRHLVCRLRKASGEETDAVSNLYNTLNPSLSTSAGGLTAVSFHQGNSSMKVSSFFRQSVAPASQHQHRINSPNSSNLFNSSSNMQSPGHSYRSNLASSMSDLHLTMQKSSISMQARRIGECEASKPLVPDLIFDQLWTEQPVPWK